jgi:hypothetical protein
MLLSRAYRTRARGFAELARRSANVDVKEHLEDLAKTCAQIAEAIERHPGIVEQEDFERSRRLH